MKCPKPARQAARRPDAVSYTHLDVYKRQGLYLVGATHEGKDYGCVVNTVTQVTAEPAKLMVAINKQNATTSACLLYTSRCV